MEHSKRKRDKARKTRVLRVRKKLVGTALRPRLSVSKTNRHVYAQLIDDERSLTLCGLGTLSKDQSGVKGNKSKESAREIGKKLAQIAQGQQISHVIFDRGRYKFHGVVAELAAGAREAGLQF